MALLTLDVSLLIGLYNAQLNERLASSGNAAPRPAGDPFGPAVVPPWDPQFGGGIDADVKQRMFSTAPLIDLDDPDFNRDSIDADTKSLFVAFKALRRMQEVARFVANDPLGQSMSSILEKQFQRYVGEFTGFIDGLDIDRLTLTAGRRYDSVKAEAISPKFRATFAGQAGITDKTAAIADIDPDAQFQIDVTKSDGTVINVAIDLSQMGATTRSLVEIVDFANGELDAAGVISRFGVGQDTAGRYRFDVVRSLSETVAFSAPVTEDAVYLAATSGSGATAAGVLRKFDDLAAADPNVAGTFRIDPEGGGSTANAVAVDSEGNVYVAGGTGGDLDGQINQSTNDLYLTKYDAAGNVIFNRLLGSAENTNGLSVVVDGNDDVIVAGRTLDDLTLTASGGGIDSFVTKFDASGEEVFTRQVASSANDSALALTIDASNNIFIAGVTSGTLDGQATGGGADAYLVKLDQNGTHQGTRLIGGAGDQSASAIAFSGGDVYIAGTDGTQAFLRRFDASTLTEDSGFQVDLGAANETTRATALAVDGAGKVYLAGYTTDAALPNFSGAGRISHQGGADGFVARIDGTSASVDFTSYVGSAATDRINGLAVSAGGDIYASGTTGGGLFGETLAGSTDAFVAKLDSTGAEQFTHQFTGAGARATGAAIAVAPGGSSVLTRLGLPHGEIPAPISNSVTANSTVRPGDFFYVAVDDGPKQKVAIDADMSFRMLAFQINLALEGQGSAKVVFDSAKGEKLEITAINGHRIAIADGPETANALDGLGLAATTLYPEPVLEDENAIDNVFELGFIGQLHLRDRENATATAKHMDSAILKIQDAYKLLIGDLDDPEALKRNIALATPPSPYYANLIANYTEALNRLVG